MSYTTTLQLVSPNGHQQKSPSLPEFPSDLQTIFPKAQLVLNHGLLIGEMLGIPIHKAQRIIDRTYNQADIAPYFNTYDQQSLLMTFNAISSALCRAINTDGTPTKNIFGKVLSRSDLLETDKDGSLVIKHRQLHLSDLQAELCVLNNLLSFAIGNSLMIKMQ